MKSTKELVINKQNDEVAREKSTLNGTVCSTGALMEAGIKKKASGITLIALIVTLLVLLILTAVTLNLLTGENGILTNAKNSAVAADVANTIEKAKLEITAVKSGSSNGQITDEEVAEIIASFDKDGTIKVDEDGNQYILTSKNNKVLVSKIWGGTATVGSDSETAGGTGNGTDVDTSDKTLISATETYALCYYDLDPTDDVDADGIIYVDLAAEVTSEEGTPASWGSYSTTINNENYGKAFKSYYDTGKTYNDKAVISAVSGSSGTERFYVMALTDISNSTYAWYNNASGKMTASDTSTGFGKGFTNTKTMIESKWKPTSEGGYADTSDTDLWGKISTQYSKGWYVPSYGEWVAYAAKITENSTIQSQQGLRSYYWTSSQYRTNGAYTINFGGFGMSHYDVINGRYVRLGATF